MYDIINKILFYGKIILLLIVFTLTLFISFKMQDFYGNQIWIIIRIFIPMFLTLSIFIVSLFFQEGNNNVLFNVACFLAFVSLMIIDFRTLLDQNMLMWTKGNTNFYYFQNHLIQLKIISYTIFTGNILLIYKEKFHKTKLK